MNLMEKAQKKKRVIKMMRKADEEYEKAMKAFILVSNEAKNDNDSKWVENNGRARKWGAKI